MVFINMVYYSWGKSLLDDGCSFNTKHIVFCTVFVIKDIYLVAWFRLDSAPHCMVKGFVEVFHTDCGFCQNL